VEAPFGEIGARHVIDIERLVTSIRFKSSGTLGSALESLFCYFFFPEKRYVTFQAQ
jgi:hypothetical protein